MSCSAIIAGLGFECRELPNSLIEVDTAFSYADGTTISFYVAPTADGFAISDNGDSIFHLISVGIPIRNRRNTGAIARLTQAHGVSLSPKGELRTECAADSIGDGIARFISAMVDIGRFERERVGISEMAVVFADEVEMYLRAWKPNEEIIPSPSAVGATGGHYDFDFLLGSELVDCIAAKGRSTGALLRKASDIRAREDAPSILAVIDDRTDPEHAAREGSILTGSGLVRVLPMTRLIRNANVPSSSQ